jgi:hypothetical protein
MMLPYNLDLFQEFNRWTILAVSTEQQLSRASIPHIYMSYVSARIVQAALIFVCIRNC